MTTPPHHCIVHGAEQLVPAPGSSPATRTGTAACIGTAAGRGVALGAAVSSPLMTPAPALLASMLFSSLRAAVTARPPRACYVTVVYFVRATIGLLPPRPGPMEYHIHGQRGNLKRWCNLVHRILYNRGTWYILEFEVP